MGTRWVPVGRVGSLRPSTLVWREEGSAERGWGWVGHVFGVGGSWRVVTTLHSRLERGRAWMGVRARSFGEREGWCALCTAWSGPNKPSVCHIWSQGVDCWKMKDTYKITRISMYYSLNCRKWSVMARSAVDCTDRNIGCQQRVGARVGGNGPPLSFTEREGVPEEGGGTRRVLLGCGGW